MENIGIYSLSQLKKEIKPGRWIDITDSRRLERIGEHRTITRVCENGFYSKDMADARDSERFISFKTHYGDVKWYFPNGVCICCNQNDELIIEFILMEEN